MSGIGAILSHMSGPRAVGYPTIAGNAWCDLPGAHEVTFPLLPGADGNPPPSPARDKFFD